MQSTMVRHLRPASWPDSALPLPAWQSHRGYCPPGVRENSLEAFRLARQLGATTCECDVHLASDGVPVVYHDESLLRLHNTDKLICELSSTDLWQEFQIPSLQAVLQDPLGPQYWNIEIKSKVVHDAVARKVARLVLDLQLQARIMISSFNPVVLWIVAQYLPNVPRAFLVAESTDPESRWYLSSLLPLGFVDVHMLNISQRYATDDFVQSAVASGWPLSVWTVNDIAVGRELIAKGVRSIITDLSPELIVL